MVGADVNPLSPFRKIDSGYKFGRTYQGFMSSYQSKTFGKYAVGIGTHKERAFVVGATIEEGSVQFESLPR